MKLEPNSIFARYQFTEARFGLILKVKVVRVLRVVELEVKVRVFSWVAIALFKKNMIFTGKGLNLNLRRR